MEKDLPRYIFIYIYLHNKISRIKSMGVDILWFLPIHPIGVPKRKGPQGSPYSISDYRAINPNYGIAFFIIFFFIFFIFFKFFLLFILFFYFFFLCVYFLNFMNLSGFSTTNRSNT